jgi:hypothetical protein
MPDDIRTDRLPARSTEKADATEPPFTSPPFTSSPVISPPVTSPPKRTPRAVGPESEVRGGQQAAVDSEQLE